MCKVFRNYIPKSFVSSGSAVALGNFDGLHLGHRSLLKHLDKIKDLKKIVVSFYPHPQAVISGKPSRPVITSLSQRVALLKALNIDALFLIRFTKDFSKLSAKDFIDDYLIKKLNLSYMILGEDACIGRDREGSAQKITSYLQSIEKKVELISFVKSDDIKIGTSKIRDCIQEGKLDETEKLLGRKYSVVGRVVKGDQRGRTIGYPTANVLIKNNVLPPFGVYATFAYLDGKKYPSISNCGIRPTIGKGGIALETNLFAEFKDEFYNKKLEVEFIKKIRDEKKFSSLEELRQQIEKDCVKAKKILELSTNN